MVISEQPNPFLLNGYQPELFCDREEETSHLLKNAANGVNTTLLAIRRMGKTGLIQHCFHQLEQKRNTAGIYIDIFDTENLRDFTNRLATAILRKFPEKTPFWKKLMDFFKQLRPVISYDSLTGSPEVTLEYSQASQYEYSLQSIFGFLDSQSKKIIIAIDEFQQITTYPETNTEAFLRTQIQPLKNIRFIFSGSSPHLLAEMFHKTSRPFFSSTQALFLSEISAPKYADFITSQFSKDKRSIDEEAVSFILEWTQRHTYYTQALCNKLFSEGHKVNSKIKAQHSAFLLLQESENIFYQYRAMLTKNQWSMLKAIGKEGTMYKPSAKNHIREYNLGTSSNIQRSLETLLDKELIYKIETEQGTGYRVYDCFFMQWLARL